MIGIVCGREVEMGLSCRQLPVRGAGIEIGHGDWTLKRADPEAIFNAKSEHPWPSSQAPKPST